MILQFLQAPAEGVQRVRQAGQLRGSHYMNQALTDASGILTTAPAPSSITSRSMVPQYGPLIRNAYKPL